MELVTFTSITPSHPTSGARPRNALSAQVKTILSAKENFVDRHIAVRRHFEKVRGRFKAKNHRHYPITTNADVKQLATLWSREIRKVSPDNGEDRRHHQEWKVCVDTVEKHADANKPNATYSRNQQFWMCSAKVAIYLQSRKGRPSTWTLIRESVVESLIELPDTLGNAAGAVADKASDAAGSVFGALSTPAKIGIAAVASIALGPPLIRAVRK